jgi:hypothetical protein
MRETLGDGVETVARDELGEDPGDNRFGFRIEIEAVESLAVRRLGGVGVRSGVHDLVPVGRASAEETALVGGCAPMAALTRILIRFRSPLLIPPNTDMTRSWASFFGSIGPPTSGTQSGTP